MAWAWELPRSGATGRMVLVCTTCTGTCGNATVEDCWNDGYCGCARRMGSAWERGDCAKRVLCAAAPGRIDPEEPALREPAPVLGCLPETASASADSAWPGRSPPESLALTSFGGFQGGGAPLVDVAGSGCIGLVWRTAAQDPTMSAVARVCRAAIAPGLRLPRWRRTTGSSSGRSQRSTLADYDVLLSGSPPQAVPHALVGSGS